jgi:hypothetical protein
MTDENSTGLPIETTVGAAGSHATEAFALLGNETRLAILLALWEEHDPHASDNVVSFSEIFDRVEYEDPGSFSYHLQELEGQFIRQYADGGGYELRVPALRFIHAVIAGAGDVRGRGRCHPVCPIGVRTRSTVDAIDNQGRGTVPPARSSPVTPAGDSD